MNNQQVVITHSAEETQKVAEDFVKELQGGDVITLYGNLGAGKTTFAQGLARGLGIKQRIISPTFVIVRTYQLSSMYQVSGIKYFYHIDLYRIENEEDLEGLGMEEILSDKHAIVAIEWSEKLGKLKPHAPIAISLHGNDNKRTIRIENHKTASSN